MPSIDALEALFSDTRDEIILRLEREKASLLQRGRGENDPAVLGLFERLEKFGRSLEVLRTDIEKKRDAVGKLVHEAIRAVCPGAKSIVYYNAQNSRDHMKISSLKRTATKAEQTLLWDRMFRGLLDMEDVRKFSENQAEIIIPYMHQEKETVVRRAAALLVECTNQRIQSEYEDACAQCSSLLSGYCTELEETPAETHTSAQAQQQAMRRASSFKCSTESMRDVAFSTIQKAYEAMGWECTKPGDVGLHEVPSIELGNLPIADMPDFSPAVQGPHAARAARASTGSGRRTGP